MEYFRYRIPFFIYFTMFRTVFLFRKYLVSRIFQIELIAVDVLLNSASRNQTFREHVPYNVCYKRNTYTQRNFLFFIFFLFFWQCKWDAGVEKRKKVNETYKVIFIFVIFNGSTYYVLFRNRSFKRNARKESWFFCLFSFLDISLCTTI